MDLTLTPTPTPVPSAELVRQAGEIVTIWNTLSPIMAVLFVAAIALGIVALMVWIGRGNSSTAINVIANANAQKDKEIAELKAQREQDRQQNTENTKLLAEQFTRANDLFEAMNDRGGERDKQQQRMVETQSKIADSFESLLKEGSAPLQKVAADVAVIMGTINGLDTRTMTWQLAIESIPQIRADFNERLDSLLKELAKRATKPIPAVIDPPSVEASPQ